MNKKVKNKMKEQNSKGQIKESRPDWDSLNAMNYEGESWVHDQQKCHKSHRHLQSKTL